MRRLRRFARAAPGRRRGVGGGVGPGRRAAHEMIGSAAAVLACARAVDPAQPPAPHGEGVSGWLPGWVGTASGWRSGAAERVQASAGVVAAAICRARWPWAGAAAVEADRVPVALPAERLEERHVGDLDHGHHPLAAAGAGGVDREAHEARADRPWRGARRPPGGRPSNRGRQAGRPAPPPPRARRRGRSRAASADRGVALRRGRRPANSSCSSTRTPTGAPRSGPRAERGPPRAGT